MNVCANMNMQGSFEPVFVENFEIYLQPDKKNQT